jgi:hypothetical protein
VPVISLFYWSTNESGRAITTTAVFFSFVLFFFEGQIELLDFVDLNRLMIVVGWDLL